MRKPDILNKLDQAIKKESTDLESVYKLVAWAYAWMPFPPREYDNSAQKYNEDQIKRLRSSPSTLTEALEIKIALAEKSHTLLERIHEKYGSTKLPSWGDKRMDIDAEYWDQVGEIIAGQLANLDDDEQVHSLARELSSGMKLNIVTNWET